MTLDIHIMDWDRHKHVAGLNQLMGYQPPLLVQFINIIFNI
jgi:hypothetical protein